MMPAMILCEPSYKDKYTNFIFTFQHMYIHVTTIIN